MKRLLAILLCVALVVTLGVPTLAEELPQEEPPVSDYIESTVEESSNPELPESSIPESEPEISEVENPSSDASAESSDPTAADSSGEEVPDGEEDASIDSPENLPEAAVTSTGISLDAYMVINCFLLAAIFGGVLGSILLRKL